MAAAARGNYLVIKHGALGDILLCMFVFQAIRRHHTGARITLLTTAPFAGLARQMPWFDQVWVDDRPRWWPIGRWFGLARRIAAEGFDRVYDLQGSDRTTILFRLLALFGRRPEWLGRVSGASHPRPPRDGDHEHIATWLTRVLKSTGIEARLPADLDWLDGDLTPFALPERIVLLVPGCSPHRPDKRWPAAGYGGLAGHLLARGLTPVLIGTASEAELAGTIVEACPGVVNLVGRTSLGDLAALARRAESAVGNDTGPMHLIAQVGCPTLVLFSASSDPRQSSPLGPRVHILQTPTLATLPVAEVIAACPPGR